MINLKWVGPIFDSSGYASSSRSYISGLINSNKLNLTLEATTFEDKKIKYKEFSKLADSYVDKNLDTKIQIIHSTPEIFPRFIDKNKYNIGYTTWETDKLPKDWIYLCNQVDELFVPSTWNKEVFINSGVVKPITVIPHIINTNMNNKISNVSLGTDEGCYVFYSIFQYIERKNPLGLLLAYLTEFTKEDNVCLVLKTYRLNTSVVEQNIIKQDILKTKESLKLTNYPTIRFFGDLITNEQIRGLHNKCDCFVMIPRAEGFSITHAEAMSFGKPTIGVSYSGNTDFMNNDNSYLVSYQLTPVYNMLFGEYNGSMTWAEPNINELKQIMRYVYNNREEAILKGKQGQLDIISNLNEVKISDLIIDRLEEISLSGVNL